jgi:aminoglycoside/choline kinase family phosphotransferase
MEAHDEGIAVFLEKSGWGGAERSFLAGDASFRHYDRIVDHANNRTAVMMDAPPDKEPLAPFIKVDNFLVERGYSAPKIYALDLEHGLLLLEDLGDDSFTKLLQREPHQESKVYLAACDALADLHQQPTKDLAVPEYSPEKLMDETLLFVDWYLAAMLGEAKAKALRPEFIAIWSEILSLLPFLPPVVVLRDYHADNLLWLPQRESVQQVGLLDFQDALIGSPAYDVVSLLEDARRDVSPETVQMSVNRYLQKAGWDKADFMVHYGVLGAQRNCKIVGIFTRLAKRDGKQHYLNLLPRVWGHLQQDLNHPVMRPLKQWMDEVLPEAQRGLAVLEAKRAG